MQNYFKSLFILTVFSILAIGPSYGDWDYYGSGRDHPYSAYIDRANYVGPADYASIPPGYIDGPFVLKNAPTPVKSPVPASPPAQPNEISINIPNVHGGYNVVVLKKSGGGFVGPDGEYYPEFPKVFQLEMKYGN